MELGTSYIKRSFNKFKLKYSIRPIYFQVTRNVPNNVPVIFN